MIRLLLLFITNILCLCILPPLNKPSLLINPSNQFETATYVFSFQLQIAIDQAAILEIEFPQQFPTAAFTNANCTFSNRVCAISYPDGFNATEYTVSIANIVNPASGGLSNFQIRTKIHASTIQQSKTFTNAGIRGSVQQFTYLQLTTDNLIAGLNSTYTVRFKVPKTYSFDVTFQLDLMTYYNQSNIVQNYTSLDQTAEYSITVPLRNPFSIDSLQDLTAKIYKGTYILVRGMTANPQFQPAPLQCTMTPMAPYTNSRFKVMDYMINLTTLYPPISQSTLQIIIPQYFGRYNSLNTSLFYQSYGNNSLSYINDRKYILNIIDNSTTISYKLRLRNPNTIGLTSPFRHSIIFSGNRYMFDETNCVTTITNMTEQPSHPIVIQSTNTQVNQLTNLTIGTTNMSVCIDTLCQVTNGTILNYTNPPSNGSYLVQVTIGNVSYTDILLVTPPPLSASITILGSIINITYSSLGITNGQIYIDLPTTNQFNCTVNNINKQCYYDNRVIINNVTAAQDITIILIGIIITGTNTITISQMSNNIMLSTTKVTTSVNYNTITCPPIHVAYGSHNTITTCLNQSGLTNTITPTTNILEYVTLPHILTIDVTTSSYTIQIYCNTTLYQQQIVVDQVAQLNVTMQLSSNINNDIGVVYTFHLSSTLNGILIISFGTDLTNVFTDTMSVETTRIVGNMTDTVVVYGVTNKKTNITVSLTSLDMGVIYANKSLPVVLFNDSSVQNIQSSVSFYPQNALTEADYTISLSVNRPIPLKSTLLIEFPQQYASLSSPICHMAGYYSWSLISNLTISIIIDRLDTVYLLNITNPFSGYTSPFTFTILYANTIIASGMSQPILILSNTMQYTLTNWQQHPTTVAQQTTFTFNIAVNTQYNQQIFVRLPYQYDKSIDSIRCLYMDTDVECTYTNWQLSIYIGQVNDQITISIMGIINIGQADYIKIGIKQSNSYMVVYTAIRKIKSTEPGYALTFNSLTNNIGYIRMKDNYNISIYTSLPITVSTMALYLVLPSRVYRIPTGPISCQCLQFDVSCRVEHNNRVRIWAIGIQTIESGLIQLRMYAVDSPIDVSVVSEYYLQIVDQLNSVVVGRTYYNLQYYTLQYRQNGPYIMVNQEQDVYVNEGSAVDVAIQISQPAIITLTVRGIGPFSMSPYSVVIAVGATSTKIRISSKKGQSGIYDIRWIIMGDMTPLYYTPIKSTTVHVLRQLTVITVSVMNNVVQLSVPYSPDTNVIVEAYNSQTLSLVEFKQGQTVKHLTINSSVSLRLSGINQANYRLSTNEVTMQTEPVGNYTFTIHNITKTTVTLRLVIKAVVVLQHALAGSIISIGRITYICRDQIFILVDNLTSNTSYQSSLHLYDGTYLDTLYYQTEVFDPVAEITFNFQQALTDVVSKSFVQSLAYTLSIPLRLLFISQVSNTTMKVVVGQNQKQQEAPNPMTLLNNLQIRPQRLKSRVKTLLIEQYAMQPGPITTIPSLQAIILNSYNIDMLSFTIRINTTGIIYSILDTAIMELPTTQQVYLGLTQYNNEPVAKRIIMAQPQSNVTFKFLQANKFYRLCVLLSNRDPNPTVDNVVTCIEAETKYPPEHARLVIKASHRLLFLLILIFIF